MDNRPSYSLDTNLSRLIRCTSTPLSVLRVQGQGTNLEKISFTSPQTKSLSDPVLAYSGQISRGCNRQCKRRTRFLISRDLHLSDSGFSSDVSKCSTSLTENCSKASERNIKYRRVPGSFEGTEKVDVVSLLMTMGMFHITKKIWVNLSLEDLGRVQLVCSTWKEGLLSDKHAGRRWNEAKEIFFENVNLNVSSFEHKAKLRKSSPRKAMSSVINILASPKKKFEKKSLTLKEIVSPSSFKHGLYTEKASQSSPGEQLKPCPQCSIQCRIKPRPSYTQCIRHSCQFLFWSPPCQSTPRVTRSKSGVSSKKSIRRLKRL